ncbi:MAG: bifunctional (p)ppGpp synthetase/guanosine-3',5'-bis(diphosphate) 3'-pyrophosphohydrolase [Candidatus Thioglobus sp.]|nr:bifunctional (p)ppGpp synthetase/guanosine-3',5'-bis(diphosphate) 3'-pyrophosphohydrolase [Candidatus Thioglobus sp.]MBT3447238.1 bifunctional (p)ppGpp synthetase/guanosine-3',5'-bis(diphosphate) 3'-pyrophosphohydrolase [Candidatus Thioglobus sp.]MBT3744855.1 bifunctional (p)ppGpp synthetase/guanosine-3',5'-bis(diphosphate) 3'-pyrophosphohydrolase [Candidatus Thioglobus sp.]MBT4000463.1 bifunctional (p)ppGpp synthetase/guanosine-3',5'-bis(diphosphate) 3'-pyrophosphohydrolase [Candidatus Thiog
MSKNNSRILISDLCEVLELYMSKSQVEGVYQAYVVAATAHDGQYRKSGEAYVFHPLSVAMILAELQLDYYCIVAALLHDCIEDTSVTYEEINYDFGYEIAHIVEGVSKLTGLEFHTTVDKQAQNFRKLFLAMSDDMRVMVIKLADRLHNMRTLDSMRRDKQLRIAKETVEIHAPIARRLGLNSIRVELDNLCFAIIHPFRHKVLASQIKKQCGNRTKVIKHIQEQLDNRLVQEELPGVEISGRQKQPCSIYKKMKNKRLKFNQVLDMYAFRVIVKDVAQCYQALGVIHNLYKPLPGKFKDYVALPKSNGYQSLHTILFGPNKIFIEVQIRSEDMHFVSEYGIAAHWHYKSDSDNDSELASNWLGSLLDIQQNSGTSVEFLEETKNDLFPSEVFVFTPEGDIMQLPYRATVLDFAYMVHTNIGNKTVKAKIDQVSAPISTRLRSGQTVEIVTDEHAKPHPSWLQMSVTAKAKAAIKIYLKTQSASELIQLGEYLLSNALDYLTVDVESISTKKWQTCLNELACDSLEDMHLKIGLSEILVSVVLNKLQYDDDQYSAQSVRISSTRDKAISFAHCCYPIPGDKVSGILTTTKGLVMHRSDCTNLVRLKSKQAQWMAVDWQPEKGESFDVKITVDVDNQRGTLASIANMVSKLESNIEHIEVQEKDNSIKSLDLVISVTSSHHLYEITQALETLKFIQEVRRI